MSTQTNFENTRTMLPGSATTQLRLGSYVAEIVPDQKAHVFRWIVQEAGSPEVLCVGQESNFGAAFERSRRKLETLMRAKRVKKEESANTGSK